MEYKDPSKRGRWIVVAGVVLALAAGGAAFYLVNQAQQEAGQGTLQKVNVVVAARPVPVRQPIVAEDLAIREVPADDTNTDAIAVRDPKDVIGQVLPVTLFQGQMITRSLLDAGGGGAGGAGGFSILDPGETVAPDSVAWRAVAITVPPDRAVGGLITAGMTVDVLLSAQINVPANVLPPGRYYTDKSTKITYQRMLVLAVTGSGYVVKATLAQAEEISHLVATGNAQFSMLMRPPTDVRYADASKLGETTNLIIERYGLPIPENYPAGSGPIQPPVATPSPSSPASPSASPGASAAP